ncbi:MAG: CooT family nickel-binding protein [Clostridia bacterium]|nr:CooT family nickel-binding protein [Clostridia bacterium]
MCESNVYLYSEDKGEELLLERVDKIIPSGDELFLENIFGERKIVKARIKEMTLVEHKIVLEKI